MQYDNLEFGWCCVKMSVSLNDYSRITSVRSFRPDRFLRKIWVKSDDYRKNNAFISRLSQNLSGLRGNVELRLEKVHAMPLEVDPAQNEVYALKRITDWRNKRVIEIGCGDGRLSLRLAQLGALVYAFDPDAKRIRVARSNLPSQFTEKIRYQVGQAESLNYATQSFDLAVFAWAL